MSDAVKTAEQPFLTHLLELRDRLLRMIVVILVIFLGLFPFGNDIYTFIAEPLMATLPEGTSMIATQVASPFLTPFKLALVAAVFLAMPFILFQLWAFIAPGLYQHEKQMAVPLLISSVALFYLGGVFAYFVVFPLVFSFLTGVVPEGVSVMTDITHYLDFVLTLFFAFGAAFEIPIATILLVWMGATTPAKLREKRPYVIVGAFVIGMLLTPPDVISQTLLAFPMWVLFEIGIIFSSRFVRAKKTDDEDADEAQDQDPDIEDTAETSPGNSILPPKKQFDDADVPVPLHEHNDYVPPTDEELDAELDMLDDDDEDDWDYDEEDSQDEVKPQKALVDEKLEKIMELRENMEIDEARNLLYEVLAEGDESQIKVARNILTQIDI